MRDGGSTEGMRPNVEEETRRGKANISLEQVQGEYENASSRCVGKSSKFSEL
jgi:hypothetical protein